MQSAVFPLCQTSLSVSPCGVVFHGIDSAEGQCDIIILIIIRSSNSVDNIRRREMRVYLCTGASNERARTIS